jgi:hypothetical protein
MRIAQFGRMHKSEIMGGLQKLIRTQVIDVQHEMSTIGVILNGAISLAHTTVRARLAMSVERGGHILSVL